MKIAVVAAAGRAGRKIVAEAANRGLKVTAFVRKETEIDGAAKIVVKDILALTADDLKDFDVVIDCFGAWTPETLPLHTTTSQHLCDLLSGTDIRLIIIGGAGSLYTDETHTTQISEKTNLPAEWKPIIDASADALNELRKRNDVKWTYISPALDFRADGERTGKYILAGEEFTLNSKGESVISYADYAIALVDEAINGKNIQKRISVLGE